MSFRLCCCTLCALKRGAYSFLQEYQKTETYRRIPVIIAAEEGDAAAERECLTLGAWDYVRKPYRSARTESAS